MGSNDLIPVPDPKPIVLAEFTLGGCDGGYCTACGGVESVLRVDLRVGQYTSYGNRCLPCRSALGRCLMRAWEGNRPDAADVERLSHLWRQHCAEASYAVLPNVDRET